MSFRTVLTSGLAGILATTLSGCGWSGLNENPLPFAAGNGGDATTLTVHLANAEFSMRIISEDSWLTMVRRSRSHRVGTVTLPL